MDLYNENGNDRSTKSTKFYKVTILQPTAVPSMPQLQSYSNLYIETYLINVLIQLVNILYT